ncbi:hypothetical protein KEM54_005629 [Ascosphaera aggregata]|nr:hypothetical protein KEM54_005629 [Ascosphaera aggregata]
MQRLISRIGLSSHTGRNLSAFSSSIPRTTTNAVTRGETTAANRRLIKGNVVTAFYSTIFAVAVLFDIQMKEKQVEQWKKQLDTAKAEMLELQIEEARLLKNLALRRRVKQLALPMQRRQYSTQASGPQFVRSGFMKRSTTKQSAVPTMSTTSSKSAYANDAPKSASNTESRTVVSSSGSISMPQDISEILDFGSNEAGDIFRKENGGSNRDLSAGNALREGAIQRLATRQLAIKLLLRPRIAHAYGSTPPEDHVELNLPRSTTGELLDELTRIKRRILQLKYHRHATYDDIIEDMTMSQREQARKEREQLAQELHDLFEEYFAHRLKLTDLVLMVSQNLLSSEGPISSATVELLITQFTRARQNDITNMVLETLLPNKFYITIPIIVSAINYFNKSRDLHGFDGFMRFLQGLSSPINMPVLWRTVCVHGIEVAIPSNCRHPYIMNALVAAALSFDQPQKADAWLHLMRETGYTEGPEVLGSYLRYYSITPNWNKGRHILLRSVAYLLSTVSFTRPTAERLILYMIILCNCCGQHELSYEIVTAAAKNGLDWRAAHNERDTRLSVRLAMRQWSIALEKAQHTNNPDTPLDERCYNFARSIETPVRTAVMKNFADRTAQKRKYCSIKSQKSFWLRYTQRKYESEQQSSQHRDAHIEKVPEEIDPSPEPVATRSDLQKHLDYISYSLKLSDVTIDDLRMELEMQARRVQLSELREQLADLKKSILV